ncbi:hypothetical protein [Rhodohalobacter sulfatireducens]|nr:hypothetical protein [Rhodohalobacter sulfatireducens]
MDVLQRVLILMPMMLVDVEADVNVMVSVQEGRVEIHFNYLQNLI